MDGRHSHTGAHDNPHPPSVAIQDESRNARHGIRNSCKAVRSVRVRSVWVRSVWVRSVWVRSVRLQPDTRTDRTLPDAEIHRGRRVTCGTHVEGSLDEIADGRRSVSPGSPRIHSLRSGLDAAAVLQASWRVMARTFLYNSRQIQSSKYLHGATRRDCDRSVTHTLTELGKAHGRTHKPSTNGCGRRTSLLKGRKL